MPNHAYQPGDRVERISTGERLRFHHVHKFADIEKICVITYEDREGNYTLDYWNADDCRPAVDHSAELAAKDAEIARLEAENEALRCHHSDTDRALSEWHRQKQRIAEIEAQVAKLEARNERMTQYVDDACECCRCCECQGWNPECSILATKRHKGIDIVTGEQLRAAAEGGE